MASPARVCIACTLRVLLIFFVFCLTVELVCADLSPEFAQRLLQQLARLLQATPHIEFYLQWSCCLLTKHGNQDGVFQHTGLLALHEVLSRKYEMLNKM